MGVFRYNVIIWGKVEQDGETGFMSTSEFDKYKVDHLFLLIGENPLPNYVAAMLLLNKGGTPYLVCTSGTEKSAEGLQTILSKELIGLQPAIVVPLKENESDAFQIQEAIGEKLEEIKNQKIGLHYTGGTKAMSVHSYRKLFYEKPDKNKDYYTKRSDVIFSYLDPRRLEMCIDREEGERDRIKVTPAMLSVQLCKVFQIHGWVWKSDPIYSPQLSEAAQAFAEFHEEGELVQLWRNWCNEVLRKQTRDDKDRWLNKTNLQTVSPLALEMVQSQPRIVNALSQLGVTGENLSLQTIKEKAIAEDQTKKDEGKIKKDKKFKFELEDVCKWLDGEWLEHYVLQQVQAITQDLAIHCSATSFWIKDPNSKNTKFQFDVAFMRGYRLFAISCTTSTDKSLCKSKLFEAYIRAQQLGGSEARVALVCCVSNEDKDGEGKKKYTKDALETEILNVLNPTPESGKRDYRLVVFGREDLINISEKIAEWIRNVDNETDKKTNE